MTEGSAWGAADMEKESQEQRGARLADDALLDMTAALNRSIGAYADWLQIGTVGAVTLAVSHWGEVVHWIAIENLKFCAACVFSSVGVGLFARLLKQRIDGIVESVATTRAKIDLSTEPPETQRAYIQHLKGGLLPIIQRATQREWDAGRTGMQTAARISQRHFGLIILQSLLLAVALTSATWGFGK